MEEFDSQAEENEEQEPRRKHRERSKPDDRPDHVWREPDEQTVRRTKSKQQPGMKTEPETRTEGRSGETNLHIECVDQWVGINRPFYFNISTIAGNEIRATVKQRAYKRDYAATGSLRTRLTPVAPIGTKGLLVVADLTTGEKLEQPWTWVPLNGGPGWFSRLWRAVKGLFVNGE